MCAWDASPGIAISAVAPALRIRDTPDGVPLQPTRMSVNPDGDQNLGRMGGPTSAAFDGANVSLNAREIELFDDVPDLAGRMVGIDETIDVEGLQVGGQVRTVTP